MSFLSFIAIFITCLGQCLHFSPPYTWAFTGTVTETKQVYLYGMPAEVAKIQSDDFYAWVILRMDEGPFEVVLGSAHPGDRVRVSIQGPHVLKNSVDWKKCQPSDSNYCRLGAFYDDGLLALEWNVPLSPSNEFIHLGHPNPSWHQALFWNTEQIIPNGNLTPELFQLDRDLQGFGCLALRRGNRNSRKSASANGPGCLPRLVEKPVRRGH